MDPDDPDAAERSAVPARDLPPLAVVLGPSRRALLALLAGHLGALACLLPLALPGLVRGALGAALAASLAWYVARHALRLGGDCVIGIDWTRARGWRLHTPRASLDAILLHPVYVHPAVVVLRFAVAARGRSRAVLICADALAPGDFRALRVRLRLAGSERPPPRAPRRGLARRRRC